MLVDVGAVWHRGGVQLLLPAALMIPLQTGQELGGVVTPVCGRG